MTSLLDQVISSLARGKVDKKIFSRARSRLLKGLSKRQLIKLESEIGSKLFGPLAKGRRREFFCLDARTWIWHEEWLDKKHHLQTQTIRYEVKDDGILKVQEGGKYSYLTGEELHNLSLAIKLYYERVSRELYRVDPSSGKPLV
jgi:hypothetical protein